MELAPAARRRLILGGLLVLLLIAVVMVWQFQRDQVTGHAFAIPSGQASIVVEVLNGSGHVGLARLGTRELRRKGFDVVFLGNAPTDVDSTRVIHRRGRLAAAEAVRSALGLGVVRTELDTLRRVDVTVILGPDYRPDENGRP